MSVYVVTAVDYDSDGMCDGKAHVLGVYKNMIDAKLYVKADIENWIDDRAGENVECDFDKLSAWNRDDVMNRCEWNIEAAEIK